MASRLPKRLEPVVFGLLVSGMMSFIVSGVSTASASGIDLGFVGRWMPAWALSWSIAFPTILIVAPLVRRMVHRLFAD